MLIVDVTDEVGIACTAALPVVAYVGWLIRVIAPEAGIDAGGRRAERRSGAR